MSSDDTSAGQTWLETLAEGGIPQILAGPAGKALSRLIGAGIEIPAAWLEQRAQSIRDETAARSSVMEKLSGGSAELGLHDDALLKRGLDTLLGRAYREQRNREAVAAKTIEHLPDDRATADGASPSDDWMNFFERVASEASSEKIQETWARVLAGEIRKPQSFSLSTLQHISVLDQTVAEAVETVFQEVINDNYLLANEIAGEKYNNWSLLRDFGIIRQMDPDTTLQFIFKETGYVDFHIGLKHIRVFGDIGTRFSCTFTTLTRTGIELIPVVDPQGSSQAVSMLTERLKKESAVKGIDHADLLPEGDLLKIANVTTVWVRSPED